MVYEYELNNDNTKKYGFTHLIVNGWFGYYADNFNKKFDDNKKCYIDIKLNDEDIDNIVQNAINCNEA